MKTTRRTIEWKIKYVKFKNPKKISELLFDELSTSLSIVLIHHLNLLDAINSSGKEEKKTFFLFYFSCDHRHKILMKKLSSTCDRIKKRFIGILLAKVGVRLELCR